MKKTSNNFLKPPPGMRAIGIVMLLGSILTVSLGVGFTLFITARLNDQAPSPDISPTDVRGINTKALENVLTAINARQAATPTPPTKNPFGLPPGEDEAE